MPRTRAALTRARVAASALEIVDRDGVDGLTMRRLADRLGVSPMALYNHVEDRRALLEDVAELVLTEVRVPPTGAWRERLAWIVGDLRACYLRHPNALPLVLAASRPSPAMLAPMEASLAALDEAGVGQQAAIEVWVALVALATGYASYQLGGHLAGRDATVDLTATPFVAGAAGVRLDWDAAFERAVDRQLASLGGSMG